MTCVILAAGYATRLYPLTENFPKPLLDVQGKSVLDWLLDDIDTLGVVSSYVVISNHKFMAFFETWKAHCHLSCPITILDDGSTSNDNRLGAVKDIQFAIDTLHLSDDLLVIAGDNVLEFSFKGFVAFFHTVNATCIMRHYEPSQERLRRTGVASINASSRVTCMQEKPTHPQSHWAVPPFYLYTRSDLPLVGQAIQAGCHTDAPGSFIAWLCSVTPVYAYEMPGKRYDIGNLVDYQEVQKDYKGIIA